MAISSIGECISSLERKHAWRVWALSVLIWLCGAGLMLAPLLASVKLEALLLLMTYALLFVGLPWLIKILLSEYQSRLIRATGARVTRNQFPEVYEAAAQVRRHFRVRDDIPIIVIEASSVNALAVRIARRKMIILFSDLVASAQDSPAQMRFLLAHEIAHCVLDHGRRRFIELVRSAGFKRGRELTCDNAGLAAANSLADSSTMLSKLAVGRLLWNKIDAETMKREAREITSGIVGHFVKRHLTHPTCGERLENLASFAREHALP